jgi:HAD superfamily hydrolase (TIGR01509 family)
MEYLPISGEGAPSLKSLAKGEQELNEPSSPIAPMFMGVELLIYDLDGVIIDSTEAICIAFNQAIESVGERGRPEEEIRGMIGVALEEMFRRVLPADKHERIGCCFDRYLEVFSEASEKHTRILDGVEETLRHFKEKGMKQTLATNKSSAEAERILGDLGIRHYFDLVIGLNDVDAPKPSPEMILLTLRRMDVELGNAVLVEDSPTGLAAGKASGVHTVAVTTGTHAKDVLVPWEPEYVLESIRGLMDDLVFT